MPTARPMRAAVLAVLLGAMNPGCNLPGAAPPRLNQPSALVYNDPNPNVALVQGFTWDPEAFFFSLATCPMGCTIPPIRVPGVPFLERSVVNGVQVSLFDPVTATLAFKAPLTGPDGNYYMEGVTSRQGPPFLPFAAPPAAGVVPLKAAGPPTLPPIPPAGYLPTLTLKPIFTHTNRCVTQDAVLVSDKGILEAVARHLSTTRGGTVTVADLVDPAKFGGVAVTWLYAAAAPPVRVPAAGTGLTASAGQVLNLDWAPPGVLPPAKNQSARGFFVTSSGTVSPLGLTVTLLAPLTGPPAPVQFTPVDPVNDPANGRPFAFPPLPPLIIAPGMISFNELPALVPNAPPPPEWVCLQ